MMMTKNYLLQITNYYICPVHSPHSILSVSKSLFSVSNLLVIFWVSVISRLEESNLAMSGQHIAFRRKRTTIKKHKKNKRSRSDLELNRHDDKMDGVRVVVCTHELRRSSDSHSTHTLHIARKWIQMQHTNMYTDTRPTWS